jgi:hypothetical protein
LGTDSAFRSRTATARQTNPYTTRHGQSAGQHQHTLRCSRETAVPAASAHDVVPTASHHACRLAWQAPAQLSVVWFCHNKQPHRTRNRLKTAATTSTARLHKTFAPHTLWPAMPLRPAASDAACLADNAMLLHSMAQQRARHIQLVVLLITGQRGRQCRLVLVGGSSGLWLRCSHPPSTQGPASSQQETHEQLAPLIPDNFTRDLENRQQEKHKY